jgi:hypothetical protein
MNEYFAQTEIEKLANAELQAQLSEIFNALASTQRFIEQCSMRLIKLKKIQAAIEHSHWKGRT